MFKNEMTLYRMFSLKVLQMISYNYTENNSGNRAQSMYFHEIFEGVRSLPRLSTENLRYHELVFNLFNIIVLIEIPGH